MSKFCEYLPIVTKPTDTFVLAVWWKNNNILRKYYVPRTKTIEVPHKKATITIKALFYGNFDPNIYLFIAKKFSSEGKFCITETM